MKIDAMTRSLALPGLFLMALAMVARAEPPPPPKGDYGDKPPHHGPPKGGDRGDRDRGDWRGGMSGFGGRPPMRGDGFDKLPEVEKKRVREALDKVWSRPEVIEAKDKAMRANEEMRDTIREALTKIDPEAAAILAKIEPKDHFDPRSLPKLPATDSPEFPKIMVQRLGMELLSFSRPERREETRKLHDRVMNYPRVLEALAKLEGSTGEERVQAVQKLREVYREAVGKEFQAARERREKEGNGPPSSPPQPSKE